MLDLRRETREADLVRIASDMAASLRHRGPDDQAEWVDAAAGIALAYRRLAIIDLSARGRQPMHSPSGRYVLVFNGEIYNFQLLRHELEEGGTRFRGGSDTEVVAAAVDEWGLEDALTRFNGMFAFAVWDRRERQLWLARDRLGEKPLYFGCFDDVFIFASELKAFRRHPRFGGRVDKRAVEQYLAYGYFPHTSCVYEGVQKVAPGEVATLTAPKGMSIALAPYWSLKNTVIAGASAPFIGSAEDAVAELELLLKDAIALRTHADVPLGAFLSGGIDSTTVVALMQAQESRPVKTFTIGFSDPRYDEAEDARVVAQFLRTDHTELHVTPAEAQAVIPDLPEIFDEPFGDSSQIPTYLVARLARQEVKVALAGDGADEVFGGYNRYLWTESVWRRSRNVPRWARHAAAKLLVSRSPEQWDTVVRKFGRLLPSVVQQRNPGDKLHKLFALLEADDPATVYGAAIAHWALPRFDSTNGGRVPGVNDAPAVLRALTEQMMYLDTLIQLPGDMLTKVDRATMAVSLEGRLPFLDHRVVEFAWRLPLSLKLRGGRGKWILRRVLDRHVPFSLIERPKMGFGVPIGDWLRGPLREWAESLLADATRDLAGVVDSGVLRHRWAQHVARQRNWQQPLWTLLMLHSWWQHQGRMTSRG